MTARYGIYFAPRPMTSLWSKASAWLGRDAEDGQTLQRPVLPALEGLDLDALTEDPRGYGFHATLKAPFELAPGRTEDDLLAETSRLSGRIAPFTAPIAPAALGPFLAFQIQGPSPEMHALHSLCVCALDPFRAPLTEFDLERRRKARLTPEQDARLLKWGYPYVYEDFRFHMTLTGRIRDDQVRMKVLSALQNHFVAETGPTLFDSLAIFRQPDRASPFTVLARFDFVGEATSL
jgi:putative phosphonate metabolism protein